MNSAGHDGSARGLAVLGPRAHAPELLAELTLPAEADSLGLARLAALHVAGLQGVPVGRLADLRLAVNEACALLVQDRVGAGTAAVRLRFEQDGRNLSIEVTGTAPDRSPLPEEVGWALLQALVEDVRMETAGGITTLTLREPLPGS